MKKPLLSLLVLVLLVFNIPSQEIPSQKPNEDFFISLLAEANGFGWNGISCGGGLAIGYGTGGALGLRLLFTIDSELISFLEINFFARYYILGTHAFNGPFVQINAGPVIYVDTGHGPNRPGYGNISAGFAAGWRFLIGSHFFIEPSLRLGYPYLVGGVVAFGYR